MVYSGAWGKLIHEKTRSRKSRDTVPLSQCWKKNNIILNHVGLSLFWPQVGMLGWKRGRRTNQPVSDIFIKIWETLTGQMNRCEPYQTVYFQEPRTRLQKTAIFCHNGCLLSLSVWQVEALSLLVCRRRSQFHESKTRGRHKCTST